MTDLSIIIVSYRGWMRLAKCLEALDSFTSESMKTEVIIVDNRSEDNRISEFEKRFQKFKFIHNPVNGGFANGCNLGADNAEGKFFLFLNPDTVASERELEKLVQVADKNEKFGILSCRQVNEKGKLTVSSGPFPQLFNLTGFQRAFLKSLTSHSSNLTHDITFPDWISGSVVLIRKEIFQNIHGFDEDFWMYYEDVDLCKRVRDMSLEVALCSDITIEHNHGGSSRINSKTASLTKTEVHISRHVYINKHFKGFSRFLIQTFLVINNIITCGLMAFLGLLFFFIPKLFARTLIFFRLISYYFVSILRLSWISPRSVNYHKYNSHARAVQV